MAEEIKQTQDSADEKQHGQKLIEWSFTEYNRYERSTSWYVWLVLIEIAVIIYSIIAKDFLFALLAIITGLILVLHSQKTPAILTCDIFEDGIQVGLKFYEWDDIKNFRIVYEPPQVKLLYLDLKNVLIPDYSLPLGDTNPLELRKILKTYLLEDLDKKYETLSDRMNRWLKI